MSSAHISRQKNWLGAGLALAFLLVSSLPSTAQAISSQQAIAVFNAERAANGIPAGITENPTWSADCAAHNNYEQINQVMQHYEDPAAQGYSDAGNWAASVSVLAGDGGSDWGTGSPWATAPIHFNQLMNPRLDVMGVAATNGFTCATTLASLNGPAPATNTTYTYPGNGVSGVPFSEVANELPYTPGQQVGIPSGTATGPYLYVMLDGPTVVHTSMSSYAHLTAASLTGPAGAVAVATVDNFTSGLQGYLPSGGEIIPVSPLLPSSTYYAHVTATIGAMVFSYDWSFNTAAPPPPPPLSPANGSILIEAGTVSFQSDSPQTGTLTSTRPATGAQTSKTISPGDTLPLGLIPGVWRVCVHQDQDLVDSFMVWDGCQNTAVSGRPEIKFSAVRRHGRYFVFTVTTDASLMRHKLAMTEKALPRGKTKKVSFIVKQQKMTFRLAYSGRESCRVSVTSRAFQSGDAKYSAQTAARTYKLQ